MNTATAAYKVVIVNGREELVDLFETVLDASPCDVVFVESNEHAYSLIKRTHPNLVVLCLEMDEAEGFQVLSMLQLDDETRAIPVLTCTSDLHGVEEDYTSLELFDSGQPEVQPAAWMN